MKTQAVGIKYATGEWPPSRLWEAGFTAGVLGVTPSSGLVVLFLGWWKQWGIAPPAHPNRLNPLSEAPTQAPGKADKQGELKT